MDLLVQSMMYNLYHRSLRCALDKAFYDNLSVTYGRLKCFPREHWLNAAIQFVRHDITEMKQELTTLPEHLCSLVLMGVIVARYLVLYVCFVDRCLSFCTFSLGHCIFGPSSIYGF
jgi:hypothetical protein